MKKFATTSARLIKSGKYYVLIGLVILVIAVAHFAMQITFIQKENVRTAETSIKAVETATADQVVNIETPKTEVLEIQPQQVEVKKVEVIKIPEVIVKPAPHIEKKTETPVRKSAKRKEKSDGETERLRRAERLLTGF